MVLKALKFRCFPTKEQAILIAKTFGCSRFLFNHLLSEQKQKEEYWFIVNEMVQNGQLPQNNWKGGFFNKVENVKKIPTFAKSISDVSWSEFFRMLEYKAIWYGKKLIKVDTYFASTQICSSCRTKNPQTKDTSIRLWFCSTCHSEHNRDANAAKNILTEGLSLLTVGTTGVA